MVLFAFIAWGLTWSTFAAGAPSVRTVLTIHTGAEDFPANLVLDPAIRRALASSADLPIEYFAEYLESDRFEREAVSRALRDYIRDKYQRRIDVVVAVTAESLQFATRYRHDLFPGAPIVFVGLALPAEIVSRADRDVAALLVSNAYGETLKLALTLHPSTKHVYVVARSPHKPTEAAVRYELRGFARHVALTYLDEATVPGLLAAVRAIPPGSLIFFVWHWQDEPGTWMHSDRVARLVAEAATVPVYGTSDFYIGSGVVGGVMRDTRETGTRIGQMARQILAGTRPRDIPIERARVVPTFDWRQVRRWAIDPSRLPQGTSIRFRPPSLWEQYRLYVVATAIALGVQFALIAGLVTQNARRRRAEEATRISDVTLRESYERIRHLAGRLINAQEVTRAVIARDLHDDVCQDLVGLSMTIDSLKRGSGQVQSAQTQRALSDLQRWTLTIVEGVRRLSHELHPASLQLLGLASATKAHCVEVEKRHDVQVSFRREGDFRNLHPDTALCLFRIAQEALRNAAVHGEARRIAVTLETVGAEVEMTITDDGRGFDITAVRRSGAGLGLVSMDERAHLVGGNVRIVTQPGMGTWVGVRVPLRTAAADEPDVRVRARRAAPEHTHTEGS